MPPVKQDQAGRADRTDEKAKHRESGTAKPENSHDHSRRTRGGNIRDLFFADATQSGEYAHHFLYGAWGLGPSGHLSGLMDPQRK